MEENKKKNDLILIGVLLVVALVAYFCISFFQGANTKNGVAVVTIDDAEYGPLTPVSYLTTILSPERGTLF